MDNKRETIRKLKHQSRKTNIWSSCPDTAETNLTRNHEVAGLIPGFTQWVKGSGIALSCGVGHRHGSEWQQHL